MAQVLRPTASTLARLALVGLVAVPRSAVTVGLVLARSDHATGRNRTVEQPVPFSHAHHGAEIGNDCRSCHTSVEVSAKAGMPPTTTCMSCHSQLWTNAEMLAPVRESFATGVRLKWEPVNRLPDSVHLNHSIHVANGAGCTTCHGVVGEMRRMRRHASFTMGWCLDCHRDLGPNLRPEEAIHDPFRPPDNDTAVMLRHCNLELRGLTDCSTCHR